MAGVERESALAAGRKPGGQSVVVKTRRRRSAFRRRSARAGWLLVSPACLLVAAFVLFPLVFAVYISLTDWPLIGPYHYIGLENYRELFSDPGFRHAVGFTFEYTILVTPPIFLVGYGLALLLRSNRPGARIFRTLYFLPFVVGLTTVSFLFAIELQPGSGGVGWLLSELHLAQCDAGVDGDARPGAPHDLGHRHLVRVGADDAHPHRRHAGHPARAL